MAVITKSYISKFGEFYDKDIVDLATEALEELDAGEVDAVFVGNMLASRLYNMAQLSQLIAARSGLDAQFISFNAACASGGLAFNRAYRAVESGEFKRVVVLGVEKMSDFDAPTLSDALMGASDSDENMFGLTFASLYGLIASACGADSSLLDRISSKAHRNAVANPNAQFRSEMSVEKCASSPMISDPLRLYHCSPFSDGASAVLIESSGDGIRIVDSQVGYDSIALKDRESLTSFASVRSAASKLSVKPSDIDVFEVHDCFAIAEATALEDLGLTENGLQDAADEKFKVNLSGGLKACGHPVGATGVKQIAYLAQHLQSSEDTTALAHNVAGTGNTAVITVLSK